MPRSVLVVSILAAILWVLSPEDGDAVPSHRRTYPWVTLHGRVVWGGKTVPRRQPLRIIRDQDYLRRFAPILSEECVVNPRNKGVRWVFVKLAPAGKRPLPIHPELRRLSEKTVSLKTAAGRFEPHLLALRQGQDVMATNGARIIHAVNWQGIGNLNNSGTVLLQPDRSHTIKGLKADRLPLSVADQIHPWMRAWLWVVDHPYFAATDADGKFTIRQAPAGSHRLISWQETTGWGPGGKTGVEITLGDSRKSSVRLELKPLPE
jgi:hypothetical protein